MATKSVTTADIIPTEEGAGIGITGLISILNRRNYESTPSYSDLGKLTDIELRTVANQANNIQAALTSGLHTVAELVSSFDPKTKDFDHLGVGWLVSHLTETLEVALEMKSSATIVLAERGYDFIGRPMSKHVGGRMQS